MVLCLKIFFVSIKKLQEPKISENTSWRLNKATMPFSQQIKRDADCKFLN
jgi:hypothetical protein